MTALLSDVVLVITATGDTMGAVTALLSDPIGIVLSDINNALISGHLDVN